MRTSTVTNTLKWLKPFIRTILMHTNGLQLLRKAAHVTSRLRQDTMKAFRCGIRNKATITSCTRLMAKILSNNSQTNVIGNRLAFISIILTWIGRVMITLSDERDEARDAQLAKQIGRPIMTL